MDEGSSLDDTVLLDNESNGSPEILKRVSALKDKERTEEEAVPARKLSLLANMPVPVQRSLAVSVSPDKDAVLFSKSRRESSNNKTVFSLRRDAVKSPKAETEKEETSAETLQFKASVRFGNK